jgi:hypothetical protein
VRKEGLSRRPAAPPDDAAGLTDAAGQADAAVQTHEDALCLVFLQTQLLGVADQLGEAETVEVLVKTMRKMSPAGLGAAIRLDLDERATELLDEAVAATEASAG